MKGHAAEYKVLDTLRKQICKIEALYSELFISIVLAQIFAQFLVFQANVMFMAAVIYTLLKKLRSSSIDESRQYRYVTILSVSSNGSTDTMANTPKLQRISGQLLEV